MSLGVQTKKVCTLCGIEKPLSEYGLRKNIRKDGTRPPRAECKKCGTTAARRWCRENCTDELKKRQNERAREWNRKNRFKLALINSRNTAKRKCHAACSATVAEIRDRSFGPPTK